MLSERLEALMTPTTEIYAEQILVSLNIRRLRLARGWTLRELGQKLHTSHSNISRWERPVTTISLSKLGELAEVFGVTIRDLLTVPKLNNTGTMVSTAATSGWIDTIRAEKNATTEATQERKDIP